MACMRRTLILLVPVATARVLSQPCCACGHPARCRPLRAQCETKTLDDFADVLGGTKSLSCFKGYLRAAASIKVLKERRDGLLEPRTSSSDKVRLSVEPFIAYHTQAHEMPVHEEFLARWIRAEFELPGFAEVCAVPSSDPNAATLSQPFRSSPLAAPPLHQHLTSKGTRPLLTGG